MSTYGNKVQDSLKHNYVTGSQAKIYINGIHIDDAFDLQYQYNETKQPVYGYNSKHYDYVLPGHVIIVGAFRINYKHDNYLYSVLKKISDDGDGRLNRSQSISKSLRRKKELDNAAAKYKNSLTNYKEAISGKTELIEQKKGIALAELLIKGEIDSEETKAKLAEEAKAAFAEDLHAEYLVAYDNCWPWEEYAVDDAVDLIDELFTEDIQNSPRDIVEINTLLRALREKSANGKAAIEKYYEYVQMDKGTELAIMQANAKIANLVAKLEKNKELLNGLDDKIKNIEAIIASKLADVTNLKSQTNQINSILAADLAEANRDTINLSNKRAEDSSLKFNLMIEYNGKVHKIIEGCTFLGHSHVIDQEGTPIQESYQFIARDIR